ncbi:VanW family protein [Haloechinothrix halophila]|uniref:VanW family protein n=1 Tax=Haloechinothrix halophila TaxID=1069073 RepID=UPI00146FB65B|nr:VanW family protein [Haloechinothrix halophila]
MSDGDAGARPAEETDEGRDDEASAAEAQPGDVAGAEQAKPERAETNAEVAEGEATEADGAETADDADSGPDADTEADTGPDAADAAPVESESAEVTDTDEPDAEAASDETAAAADKAVEAETAEPHTTESHTTEADADVTDADVTDADDADATEADAGATEAAESTAADADTDESKPERSDAEATAVIAATSAASDGAETAETAEPAEPAEEADKAEADKAEEGSGPDTTGTAETEPERSDAEPPTIQHVPVDLDPKTVQIGAVTLDETAPDGEAPDAAAEDETSEHEPAPRRKPVLASVGAAVVSLFARLRKTLGIAAAVLAALTGLYLIDLLATQGEIPRNVVVAGVEIGGLEPIEAESVLRLRLSPRLDQPRTATADGESIEIEPDAAEVTIDWAATVDAANTPDYNPFTRALSLFTDREVDAVASGNNEAIAKTLSELAESIDVAKVEGTVEFDGTTPVPVQPAAGKRLDVARGVQDVITGWVKHDVIPIPVDTLAVKATPDGVRRALNGFARTAVSEPITLEARGRTMRMTPGQIARVVTFTANDDGSLSPRIPPKRLRKTMGKRLASTEVKGEDARIEFGKKRAKVKPSVDGTEVEWKATSDAVLKAANTTDEREVNVAYHDTPAELTTKELKDLGIKEVIGKFTTHNFASDSGVNIKRVAKEVHGAIVRPDETFSLNGHTGPRGIKQGYVAAAIIENGELTRAVGGGISQFATTLYNAAYFAGMADVEHREHSRYISRYPLAREATVFQNPDGSSVIDLKFRNTTPNGVAIETKWTPTSITVKLWGTKHFKVKSVTSEPFNYTSAPVVVKPYGTECVPQEGASGYSATNTRIIRTLDGELVDRETRTVVYQPTEEIQCAPPPAPDPEPEPDGGPDEPPANGSPSTETSEPSPSAEPTTTTTTPDDSGGLITDG